MISTSLVLVAIAVDVAALVVGLALLVGHGVWLAAHERKMAPRRAVAHARILSGLVDRPGEELPVGLLDGLPVAERLLVLGQAGHNVAGAQRAGLRDLARRAGLLDRARRLSRSRLWKRRLRGTRIYTLLGGGEDEVPRLFDDAHAEVRAEAAVWAAEHPERGIVERLLLLLGDEATHCRFTVKDSLLRLGPSVVEPLRDFLATASGRRAADGLEVAAALRDPRLLEAAFRLLGDEDPTARSRAIDLLGALGGERAAASLVDGLSDPSGAVRAAAARGLGHGHHWSAAGRLAAAMRDGDWEVRRAAGMALRRLDAPGELLLERMRTDADGFARDMARLMLEVPRAAA